MTPKILHTRSRPLSFAALARPFADYAGII